MAASSWGAPTLEFFKLTPKQVLSDSDVTADWSSKSGYVQIKGDDILEGSTTLETSEGETKTLKNATGNDVDSKKMPSSYNVTTSVLRLKGDDESKFESNNGIVAGEYAFRLIPEDAESLGFCFRKATISTSMAWSEDNGLLENLTIAGIQPNGDDHEICKVFTKA